MTEGAIDRRSSAGWFDSNVSDERGGRTDHWQDGRGGRTDRWQDERGGRTDRWQESVPKNKHVPAPGVAGGFCAGSERGVDVGVLVDPSERGVDVGVLVDPSLGNEVTSAHARTQLRGCRKRLGPARTIHPPLSATMKSCDLDKSQDRAKFPVICRRNLVCVCVCVCVCAFVKSSAQLGFSKCWRPEC